MIVVFLVVLVVFGPQKLPELARGLGKLMAEFRKASTDFKYAFEQEMRDLERQTPEAEKKKAEAAAAASGGPAEPGPPHAALSSLQGSPPLDSDGDLPAADPAASGEPLSAADHPAPETVARSGEPAVAVAEAPPAPAASETTSPASATASVDETEALHDQR